VPASSCLQVQLQQWNVSNNILPLTDPFTNDEYVLVKFVDVHRRERLSKSIAVRFLVPAVEPQY